MFDRKTSRETLDPEHSAPEPAPASEKPTRSTPQPLASPTTAVIGATVKICGDIISDENLLIEGEVEGSITLNDHELTVGESGRINADITARTIRIDGQVQGDITGKEKLVISKTGNVHGNVVSSRVILEDGGRVKGSIDMGQEAGQSGGPAAKPELAAKPHLQAATGKDEPNKEEPQKTAKQG